MISIHKNLIRKILFYDLVIGVLPLVVLSIAQYFISLYFNFQPNYARFVIIFIIISAFLALMTVYLKMRVVLYPIEDMMASMRHYQLHNELTPIRPTAYREVVVLNSAMVELVDTIKEREEQLMRAKKLRVVGEMASSLSHEIRNPITTIRGSFQLLQARPDDKELFNQFAPVIMSELDHINQIVENLLDYSKQTEVTMKTYDLKAIVDEVLLLQMAIFHQNGIRFRNELTEGVLVYTDKNRLKQVISNVLRNATEAMETGGTCTVAFQLRVHDVVLSIKDTGKGIPADQLAKIGTPFFTTKENGNGLGLAMSIKVMNGLQGTFKVTSEEGRGTAILLTIPSGKRTQ